MSTPTILLLLAAACNISVDGFFLQHKPTKSIAFHAASSTTPIDSWQQKLDSLLDIDTPCENRRGIARDLIGKWQEISKDVIAAVQERDISTIAPKNLEYGRSIAGIQSVQKQLVSDILPELLSKGVPKLLEEGPKQIQSIIANPDKLISKGKEIATNIKELSEDASALQSTVDDLRREIKNVLRRTPEGLETPVYQVTSKTDIYEIRTYSPYSIVGTKLSADEDPVAATITGTGFNTLANYLFGENSLTEKMSMTTPVIMEDGNMEFVLPSKLTADTAPIPAIPDIFLKDIPSETVASLEFTGFATDGEVARQRALLEDALLTDGIQYDNLSFKVLQYNPPYTLPWLRRNEVLLKVVAYDFKSADASEFTSAPEAGD